MKLAKYNPAIGSYVTFDIVEGAEGHVITCTVECEGVTVVAERPFYHTGRDAMIATVPTAEWAKLPFVARTGVGKDRQGGVMIGIQEGGHAFNAEHQRLYSLALEEKRLALALLKYAKQVAESAATGGGWVFVESGEMWNGNEGFWCENLYVNTKGETKTEKQFLG